MADTLDVLTLAEAKAAVKLGATDSSKNALVAAAITSLSRSFDSIYGPVVQRTVTSELHDGGGYAVALLEAPVTAASDVTTVTEYVGTASTVLSVESNSSKPANAYLVDRYPGWTRLGLIRRRSSDSDDTYPAGRLNVEITYEAGRYATTAAVDERFKEAARLWLANRWRAAGMSTVSVDDYDVPHLSFPSFAIPNFVKEQLVGERPPVVAR